MTLLLHITSYREWVQAQEKGEYRAPSLEREGFINCSTPKQVVAVANSMYHGERDLVVLCLDATRLEHEVVYEDCYDTGQRFPHLYGPVNLDAINQVLPLIPDSDGKFEIPRALAGGPTLRCDYPILEFDPARRALIEPAELLEPVDIASRCVLCFFQDVIGDLKEQGRLRHLHDLKSEIGTHPVYEIELEGERVAVCHPGLGAPLAAAFMEELYALGCRRFIACGGAGVLDSAIGLGQVIVPQSAVRDEGVSYHYLPPSREVAASPEAVAAIEKVLRRDQVDYVVGKTWTTDAVYRETPAKIALRRAEGCLTVEMEAAAFFAVAQFRGAVAGQILYAGDDVGSDAWDSRHWQRQASVREKLFWLAAEACREL